MSRSIGSTRALLNAVVLGIALGAGACGTEQQITSPSDSAATIRRIVVLGDSLSLSPSPPESFPAVLQARLNERDLRWTITNAGIWGDTTTGGRRRVDALLGPDVGVLVLALGANDGLHGADLDTIEENLSTIIQRTKSRGIDVLLCGMEAPPLHGFDYSIDFHFMFRRVASEHDVPMVPFLLSGVVLDPDRSDGFHPNRAGAERIAENVWRYLEPLLSQKTSEIFFQRSRSGNCSMNCRTDAT